jgi:hypothetical protein
MKLLILFAITSLCTFTLQAQTKYIAFKSHAGDMDYFIPDEQPEDDFGLPPSQMTKIKKINDSTVVEYAKEWGSNYTYTDTVVNHIYCSNPNITVDSLKKIYPDDIEFEGFDKEIKKTPLIKEKTLEKEKPKREIKNEHQRAETPFPFSNDNNDGNAPLFILLSILYCLSIFIAGSQLFRKKSQIA